MTVGLADKNRIFYSKAAGVGNPVVYVGSKTGRDGIHGATMASAEFSEDSEEKRPTVQVGDPFTEKLLIEACLELMQQDAIVAIQDMGAAGLTSSSVEMASKGGVGIELDLDKVPQREAGMVPYEMMLSESQERMLMVLKPGREAMAEAIFRKWGLDFAVIGKITDSGRLKLKFKGEIAGDIPINAVTDEAPAYTRPVETPPKRAALSFKDVPAPNDLNASLVKLIGGPNLSSRRWIWEQYDHMVMADTIGRPGGDAAVVRVHGTHKALAISADCNPRYCEADPYLGAMQAVVETWRNITAAGGTPLAITDCMNFGSPENPLIMGQFSQAVDGIAAACKALDYPVVSGNVSFYNETQGKAIKPVPGIGGVGLLKNYDRRADIALKREGDSIFLIGETKGHLGASIFLKEVLGREEGAPPPVDLALEKKHGDFVRALITEGLVDTAHDLADGGLAAGLADMCLAGNRGAVIDLKAPGIPPHAWLFGEDQARYLVACRPENEAPVLEKAKAKGILIAKAGTAGGAALKISGAIDVPLKDLNNASEDWFTNYMKSAQ
jgi:phosphoribosylformylglycinamidine synthase subunit PurL